VGKCFLFESCAWILSFRGRNLFWIAQEILESHIVLSTTRFCYRLLVDASVFLSHLEPAAAEEVGDEADNHRPEAEDPVATSATCHIGDAAGDFVGDAAGAKGGSVAGAGLAAVAGGAKDHTLLADRGLAAATAQERRDFGVARAVVRAILALDSNRIGRWL
jgi:hypothetical protein